MKIIVQWDYILLKAWKDHVYVNQIFITFYYKLLSKMKVLFKCFN